MRRRRSRVAFGGAAASGAGKGEGENKGDKGEVNDASFDDTMVHWIRWREMYPVRGKAVIRIDRERPPKSQQKARHQYVRRNLHGRLLIEWRMPPFLAPISVVPEARGGTGDEAALVQVSIAPASGVASIVTTASGEAATHQHYTNLHRMTCLARSHPLVLSVGPRKLATKNKDPPTVYDNIGRATRYHQSRWDLELQVGPGVDMQMGRSVNGATQS